MNFDWLNTIAVPLGIYAAFWILELVLPKPKPALAVQGWWGQVSLLVLFRLATVTAAIPWLASLAARAPNGGVILFLWPEAGPAAVSLIVIFAYTFFHYWSHRLRHKIGWLWRTTHQMHHAPNRFDLSLAVFVHPLDVLFIMGVMFLTVQLVCGFAPEHVGMIALVHSLLDKPMHMNVNTPKWSGYFLFRPEQHSLHHETHDNNYGLIPLWDLLFGTFKNCDRQAEKIGFPNLGKTGFWNILFCKKAG